MSRKNKALESYQRILDSSALSVSFASEDPTTTSVTEQGIVVEETDLLVHLDTGEVFDHQKIVMWSNNPWV